MHVPRDQVVRTGDGQHRDDVTTEPWILHCQPNGDDGIVHLEVSLRGVHLRCRSCC